MPNIGQSDLTYLYTLGGMVYYKDQNDHLYYGYNVYEPKRFYIMGNSNNEATTLDLSNDSDFSDADALTASRQDNNIVLSNGKASIVVK